MIIPGKKLLTVICPADIIICEENRICIESVGSGYALWPTGNVRKRNVTHRRRMHNKQTLFSRARYVDDFFHAQSGGSRSEGED